MVPDFQQRNPNLNPVTVAELQISVISGLRAENVRLEIEIERLQRAIVEHQTGITNAGTVRVDDRDRPIAENKHRLDQWLWAMIKPAEGDSHE